MFVTINVYLNIMFLHIACGFELLHNPFKVVTNGIFPNVCCYISLLSVSFPVVFGRAFSVDVVESRLHSHCPT